MKPGLKTSHFQVKKPVFQRNSVLTIIFKYIVLAIVTFLFVLTVIGFSIRNSSISFEIFLGIGLITTLFIYLRYFLRKLKLSDIYEIQIDTEKEEINFKSIGRLQGLELTRTIPISNLTIDFEIQNSSLYGQQRIFSFFDNSKLYNTLNIEKTAWIRYGELDEMIHQIGILGNLPIEQLKRELNSEEKYR